MKDLSGVCSASGRFVHTFLYDTTLRGHYGFNMYDDYVKVSVDHPIRSSRRRGNITSRLNAWYKSKRRPPLDSGSSRTTKVGTISAAVVKNLRRYISDYVHLLIRNGHLDPQRALRKGRLPIVLHIDGKREGYSGTRGEVFPILLHFPTARRPGRHVAWLPIGVIIGSGSAAAWNRLFLEYGLGSDLTVLDHMTLNILNRPVLTDAIFLGDYAAIRILTRTSRSNIPFPCRNQDHRNGLDAEWFRCCPCAFCRATAFEVYESTNKPAMSTTPDVGGTLLHWPISKYFYGTMHAMMHLAGGFFGDVARLFDQIWPKSPAAETVATIFVHPSVPQSEYTFDPLYKLADRKISRVKAQPTVYEAVFESEATWQHDMTTIRQICDDPTIQEQLRSKGVNLQRIPDAMDMVRALHFMWRSGPLNQPDPSTALSRMERLSNHIDCMWLSIVRVMLPPSSDVVPGPSYNANNSGRGIASHVALQHLPRQQVRLGPLAPRLSEKGGENMNSFVSDIFNRYRLSRVPNKRVLPRILLEYLIMIIFGRVASQKESTDIVNECYSKKLKSLAVRRPIRKRWRGPGGKAIRKLPTYIFTTALS